MADPGLPDVRAVTMRCWQCGVEPLDVIEVTTLSQAKPEYVPGRWPPGDHPHALRPPTPQELVDDGHQRLRRILEDW